MKVVHHINGDRTDNRIENLFIVGQGGVMHQTLWDRWLNWRWNPHNMRARWKRRRAIAKAGRDR
jgi:hypothetical protein